MPDPDTEDDAHLDPLDAPELLETLAAIEHERWSHWQRYMHSKCAPGPNGALTIPPELAQRWATQMNTPYEDLPADQRASDREQVQRYLPLIRRKLRGSNQDLGRPPQ